MTDKPPAHEINLTSQSAATNINPPGPQNCQLSYQNSNASIDSTNNSGHSNAQNQSGPVNHQSQHHQQSSTPNSILQAQTNFSNNHHFTSIATSNMPMNMPSGIGQGTASLNFQHQNPGSLSYIRPTSSRSTGQDTTTFFVVYRILRHTLRTCDISVKLCV